MVDADLGRGPRTPKALALGVLLVLLGAFPLSALAIGAGPVAAAVPTPPRPPEQPAHGPGGAAFVYDGVSATRFDRPPTGYWLFEPTDLRIDSESVAERAPVPVVVFLHGFTAVDPRVYRAWIDHIVRRGATVIYPDYQTVNPFGSDWATFLPNTVNAIRSALEELTTEGRTPPDRSRLAIVGHSLGGTLAAAYAAVAAEESLPPPVALMVIEPGGCNGCGEPLAGEGVLLPDLTDVPAATRALVVVGEDDNVVGDRAAKRIWAELTSVPTERRDYVTLVSDHRGLPPLRATHFLPQSDGFGGVLDALDWFGTWKLFDLLTACAFDAADCAAALGGTREQRFMGVWSDGEPVAAARVTDHPGPP